MIGEVSVAHGHECDKCNKQTNKWHWGKKLQRSVKKSGDWCRICRPVDEWGSKIGANLISHHTRYDNGDGGYEYDTVHSSIVPGPQILVPSWSRRKGEKGDGLRPAALRRAFGRQQVYRILSAWLGVAWRGLAVQNGPGRSRTASYDMLRLTCVV